MNSLTPWDAFNNMFQGFSLSEFLWIIIGISGVFIFYYLSAQRKRNDEYSWKNVLFWVISMVGWCFIMLMVAYGKIEEGGRTSQISLISSGLLMFITILFLTKQTRIWEKIVSGALIALIGFGILAAFGTGQNSIGYALVMGLVGGGLVGQFISSTKGMYYKLSGKLDEIIVQEKGKNKEKDKNNFSDWITKKRQI